MRQHLSFSIYIVTLCLLLLVTVCHSQQEEIHLSEVISLSQSKPIKLKQFKRDPVPMSESRYKTDDEDTQSTETSTAAKENMLSKDENNAKTTQFTPSTTTSQKHTHKASDTNTSTPTDTSTITHESSNNEIITKSSSQSTKSKTGNAGINSKSVKKTTTKSTTITKHSLSPTTTKTIKSPSSKADSFRSTTHEKDNTSTTNTEPNMSTLTTDGSYSSSKTTTIHTHPSITTFDSNSPVTTTAENYSDKKSSTIASTSTTSNGYLFSGLFHHKTEDSKSLTESTSGSDTLSSTVTQTLHSNGVNSSRKVPSPMATHPSDASSSDITSFSSHNQTSHNNSDSLTDSAIASNTFSSVTAPNKTASSSRSGVSSPLQSIMTALDSEHNRSVAGPTPNPTTTLDYNNSSIHIPGTATEAASSSNAMVTSNTMLAPTATGGDASSSGTVIRTNVGAMSSKLNASSSGGSSVGSSAIPTAANGTTISSNETSSPTEVVISGSIYAAPSSPAISSGTITSFGNDNATPVLTNTDYMTAATPTANASYTVSQSVSASQSTDSALPTSGNSEQADNKNSSTTSTIISSNSTDINNQTTSKVTTEVTTLHPTETSTMISYTIDHSGLYSKTSPEMVLSTTSVIATPTDTSSTVTIDTTTTTTNEPTTTTTTTDASTFSPNSVYQYETLAWLSEPFSYNTRTHKKTKTAKPTSTTLSSHSDSSYSSGSSHPSGNDNSNDDDANNDDDSGDDDNDGDDDKDDSSNSSKSSNSSNTVKTAENNSKKQTSSHPEYITPNINAIIPQTSSIAYLRFHTLSYNTLVSDSLLTAQFVQELPVMISQALNISTNDVIFLTITSEKNDNDIKSLFKRAKKKGLITALAIPITKMNALDQLVKSKNSSLYLPANKQIVSMLDRSYPIAGPSVTLSDPNSFTQTSSNNSQENKSSGLPVNTLIGISVGVGVAVYAAATIVGVKIYKRRKQQHRDEIASSIGSPVMQSNSLGWQVYPPESQLYKVY